MNDQSIPPGEGILHHAEGVDLIPANIELAGMEVSLVNCMNREKMLKQVLEGAKHEYDFILLDCTPSLGMLTVNALAAADTTLIPVQAQYLSAKGLEQLLQTVQKVRRQINPKLKIEGILLTMTDSRTNYGQQMLKKIVLFPISLFVAFLALMARWLLTLSSYVVAPLMLYIFGCGIYTAYRQTWNQFLILLVAEFLCFVLFFGATAITEGIGRFSEWLAEL